MKEQERRLAEGILFTDFYQLTMAQLYYRSGIHEKEAQFDYSFRTYPHYGTHAAGYCVFAGLEWLLEWMKEARFGSAEISYLSQVKGVSGKRMFGDDFLSWLKEYGSFDAISMQAVPEGRVVHPHEPVAVIRGPLIMAQILESALLNHLNYQTLIATKASRIAEAAGHRVTLEFGMRRAHSMAANAGARAALIGGADFSSNTGISAVLGIQPKGTHAHSMVQAFLALGSSELDAFRAYADVYPDDCLFLVDTIDTLHSGIPNAVTVFRELKTKGHTPVGIRLDSGDLAYLSIMAAKMLDEAGFPDTVIVLSNRLDEMVIWQIITQIRSEASRYGVDAETLIRRLVFGVGTGLITSHGDAALDGVYKLSGVSDKGAWIPALKISETPAKIINPGLKKVWRIYDGRQKANADLVATSAEDLASCEEIFLHHPVESEIYRTMKRANISRVEQLLVDVVKEGNVVCELPPLESLRRVRQRDVDALDSGVKRLINPHVYHVSISRPLWELKEKMIREYKQ